jgi:hypothetical protein
MKSEIIGLLFTIKYLITQNLPEVMIDMYCLGTWTPFLKINFVVDSNLSLSKYLIINMNNDFQFIYMWQKIKAVG